MGWYMEGKRRLGVGEKIEGETNGKPEEEKKREKVSFFKKTVGVLAEQKKREEEGRNAPSYPGI